MNHDHRNLAIVFDFGRVLLDWDPRYLYRRYFPDDPQAMERFLSEVNFYQWVRQQDAGRPFAETVAELCDQFPHYCELIRAYDIHYEDTITGPIRSTVEVLSELKRAGYPLYGLSNWPAGKFAIVRPKFEFLEWFDDIVISGEIRIAKPDARIFAYLLERAGKVASQCLFIDDSSKNIATASQLGFQTVLFESGEKLREALVERGLL